MIREAKLKVKHEKIEKTENVDYRHVFLTHFLKSHFIDNCDKIMNLWIDKHLAISIFFNREIFPNYSSDK